MHEIRTKSLLGPSSSLGMNLYRGCLHGCIYCDSRSSCYQFDHSFTDVAVKVNAPALLEQELTKKRKRCMIGTGSMCDPYIPLEMELGLTRACLQIIQRHGFGLALLTKSASLLRDLDVFEAINAASKCVIQMTLTTFDTALCRKVEPHVSTTEERLAALAKLKEAGIPTVAWLSPILPFINDTKDNIDKLLSACVEVGVKGIMCFGMGVTLRTGSRDYFYRQLDIHFPGLRARYEKTFGNAYECNSPNNAALMRYFSDVCAQHHILSNPKEIFAYLRAFPEEQLRLF